MSKPAHVQPSELIDPPDVDHLVTEDDAPVDNLASEKQQRLLTEPLYSSWPGPGEGRAFLAAANVGLFPAIHRPPLVPDVFLSLDVRVPDSWWEKRNRSYFVWEYGKAPEVVIELVSNTEGNETGSKLIDYARAGVPYYAIHDPQMLVQPVALRVYELRGNAYALRPDAQLPGIGLGLVLWIGEYEGKGSEWLRWVDAAAGLIPTGAERAEAERQRAEAERQRAEGFAAQVSAEHDRAEAEHQRAEDFAAQATTERDRADRLAARLRALGLGPDDA